MPSASQSLSKVYLDIQPNTSQVWPAPDESLSKRAVEILHLLAEGMSDREIAARLVMTINTVKWYNRQIYSILDVGSRTQAIARARDLRLLEEKNGGNGHAPSPLIAHRTPRHNLPVETTHFIGRRHEIKAIQDMLTTARLLTLVGPPGTGKTRLALQVGWEFAEGDMGDGQENFRDGVYFVSLASLNDPALVSNAIAGVIGVNEAKDQPLIETLKHALRERQILLILDNFEHLLPAATQVSGLLSAAPHLKVLATSREPLYLYGEQEYAVPPLALPDAKTMDPETLLEYESIALFIQQARTVRKDFVLTPENAPDIVKICLRLEGLPLAIELAATRIKMLTPQSLLARLANRLDTLRGGAQDLPARQQTLLNTIEWSYNLLNKDEKTLFARLTIFRGGCSLEAIETVCSIDLSMDVFDCLESLVNKSLIQQHELPGGDPRFSMLDTIHDYAWERLKASNEVSAMSRQHALYFVQLAEQAEPELRQAQSLHWFQVLKTEYENMRAILQWSLEGGDITLGVRLAAALYLFWYARGRHIEGRQWTRKMLARLDEVSVVYHPKLLLGAGHMAMLYDLEEAKQYFERGLTISRDLGDKLNMAWSLTFLGYSTMREKEAAYAITQEGLALFQELNYKPGIAQAFNIIGEIAKFSGDDQRARQAYEACLAVAQETGEIRRIRFMYGNLTFIAQHEGDHQRARESAEHGLQLAIEMNTQLDIAECLMDIAGPIGLTGQPEKAARLFGAWEAAMERMGASIQPADMPDLDRNITAIRDLIGSNTFEEAWANGRTLSLDQATALAFEHSDSKRYPE